MRTRASLYQMATIVAMVMICTMSAQAQRWNWTTPALGVSFDEAWSLGIAPSGDLFITGTFIDSMSFGSQMVRAYGNYDVYTARYSSKGEILAAHGHGGSDVDDGQSLVVDNQGNYYFAGSFTDQATIAGEYIEVIDQVSTDMYVAKVNKNGSVAWVKVFGSPTYDEGAPFLAVDSLGNIYITGGVGGKGQFGTKLYQSVGKLDAFVAKMSANGDFVWVQGAGSINNDQGQAISVSSNGDRIYASGTFSGTVSFGNVTIESFLNPPDFFHQPDFFVWGFNANGTPLWTKRIGYRGTDRNISSTATADGKLLLTGAMSQTTTFDTRTLTANGDKHSDFFLCRMTKDGTIDLLKSYGGPFEDVGTCITADAKGNIFIGGYYDSTTTVSGYNADAVGGRDGFVTRMMQNGDTDWFKHYGGPYDDETRGIVIDPKNIPYICGVFESYALFDEQRIEGERFMDVFIAALDCGPSTVLKPTGKALDICEGQDRVISARSGYPVYEWYVNATKVSGNTSYTYSTGTLAKGTYKIYSRVTGFDDCIRNSDTMTVTVRQGLPVPTITRTAEELRCSVDGMIYEWYREGNKIAGATTQTLMIEGIGNYRVRISDTSGCDRWSDNFLVGTTAVFENESGSIVTVYPNPTQGQITIAGAAGSDVTITDMLGRVVVRLQNIADVQLLTIDGTTGTYAVTLRSGNAVKTMLFTKQ